MTVAACPGRVSDVGELGEDLRLPAALIGVAPQHLREECVDRLVPLEGTNPGSAKELFVDGDG